MIRFGHTSDWHLTNTRRRVRRDDEGVSIRLRDAIANIRSMIRFLQHHKADFLLVAGDIFDSTPDEVTRELFAEVLGELMWADLKTVFTIGQHDIGRRDHFLEAFKYIAETYPMDIGDVTVIDELSDHLVVTGNGYVNLVVQPWQRDINPQLWPSFMAEDFPNILMGHFAVLGGMMNDSFKSAKGISSQYFKPFDYVALGDFHNPKQPWYSGSIARVSFSERDQRKGFRFVTMDSTGSQAGKIKKVEFVDIHDRPFVQIAGDLSEEGVDPPDLSGDPIVKLMMKGTSDEVATFARTEEERVRRQLIEAGAGDVIVNYETVNIDREMRAEGLSAGVGIDEAMEIYIEKHPPQSGNLKDMEDLLKSGRKIVEQVRGSVVEESDE